MRQIIFTISLIILLLTGCQNNAAQSTLIPQSTSTIAEPETTPTESITPSPTSPPPSATLTAVPSATPSPTPEIQRTRQDPWELQVGPLPAIKTVIAENNLAAIQQLARWGKGYFEYHVINAIRFSPDSKVLGVGTTAGEFIYDALTLDEIPYTDGEWQKIFPGVPLNIRPIIRYTELYRGDQLLLQLSPSLVALSPDEAIVADFNEEYVLAVWETTAGEQLFAINGQDIPGCWDGEVSKLVSIGVSPGGQNLAVFCRKPSQLFLLNFDGQAGKDFDMQSIGQDREIISLRFSPDGSLLAGESVDSNYKDTRLFVWQVSDGKLVGELVGQEMENSQVQSIAISPDNRQLAAGYSTGMLLVWDLQHPDNSYPLHPEAPGYGDLAFSPDGSQIAVDFSSGQPAILDANNGSMLQRLEWPEAKYPWVCDDFEFSQEGNYLACLGYDAKVWDLSDYAPVKQFSGQCCTVHFYPPGSQLAVIEDNIVLHELPDGAAWSVIQVPADFSYGFDFSPDGKLAVLGSWEAVQILQAQQNGKKWKNIDQVKLSYPYKLVLSPDGKSLAIVGESDLFLYRVKKWELITHQEREFQRFADSFEEERYGMVFSPDGTLLATGSGRDIHLRRAGDGALLFTLKGHRDIVTSLAFSPDGRLLISASLDGTLRVWGIP